MSALDSVCWAMKNACRALKSHSGWFGPSWRTKAKCRDAEFKNTNCQMEIKLKRRLIMQSSQRQREWNNIQSKTRSCPSSRLGFDAMMEYDNNYGYDQSQASFAMYDNTYLEHDYNGYTADLFIGHELGLGIMVSVVSFLVFICLCCIVVAILASAGYYSVKKRKTRSGVKLNSIQKRRATANSG